MSQVITQTLRPAAPPSNSASRASWSGQLLFGPLAAPVKAYPALVVPSSGPLHQVHTRCGARICQRRVCPTHGEIPSDEIGKAFESAPGDPLICSSAELESLAVADDKTIHVESLLPPDKLELSLLSGRSMFLVPAHPAVNSLYAQAALFVSERNLWAIGRMVLSDARRLVALQSMGQRLVLHVLHWPEHRRACPSFDMDAASVSAQDRRALEKALLPLFKSIPWETFRDEQSERLTSLIASKVARRTASRATATAKSTKKANGAPPNKPGNSRSRRAA